MKYIHKRLDRLLEQKRVPHALLFVGEELEEEARSFAKRVIGSSLADPPDLHFYRPEGRTGMYAVHAIRRLIEEVALHPFEGAYKVCVLCEAERMLPSSSNALLKTVEEPPPRTVLILLTSRPKRLLPTLISRCQTFQFERKKRELEPVTLRQLMEAGEGIEARRKHYVEEALNHLPKELTLASRELLEKEIESMATVRYVDEVEELLKRLLETLWDQGRGEEKMVSWEKRLKRCLLGVERGIKLSTCLEVLCINEV